MSQGISTYHECLQELQAQLADRGSLGIVVLDASAMAAIEGEYGVDAYEEVRQRLFRILAEARGKDFRSEDVVALDTPRGLRFVIILDRKRRRSMPIGSVDLRAVRARLLTGLVPSLARAVFPYQKSSPEIEVGTGLVIHNPLVHTDRLMARALQDALAHAAHERQAGLIASRERLQDIIVRGRVITAYQAILLLKDRSLLGFEALSRGARGSGLESADVLFGSAEVHDLLIELDRLCRQRALLSSGRIPSNARIFVNTLPATIRDPQFRGRPLIDFLDKAQVSPERIVIEITEKLVIDNYTLFREAMDYFIALGINFAVDDVGSGYSGLESIARLKPLF
ncbi:MAG TPA: EAL domain-containing protein, partial [Solirubrobacterales bacterium]|nr:EAL domain-containing protein [Solirubrobacterales bacterium]